MNSRFHLVHIGINCENGAEAESLARLLCGIFGLELRQGTKSAFAGDYIECMRGLGWGRNGHIAMGTPDLDAAVAELRERGISFREDTAAYFEDGRLKNIYLDGEFGGFAIHILCW